MTKFREFMVDSGMLVLVGKSAENNEELIKQVEKREMVLHTSAPGSPFANIKGDPDALDEREIMQAAVFCAVYSQDWKKNRGDVEVDIFLGKDILKKKGMKTGTFGVKRARTIKVKKEDIDKFEKEMKK